MTDSNRPNDPGPPEQNPQVPSAGSPYGPPGGGPSGYGQPGQQPPGGYGQPPAYGYGQPSAPNPGQAPAPGFTAPGFNQPVGGQPGYQSPGGPGAPAPGWGTPPPPPGQQAKPGNKIPLIIGGAVVVVIALVIGLMQLGRNSQTTGTPGTGSPSAQPSQGGGVGAGSAKETVQKYFDALAVSDPDAIFGLVRGDLPDRTLLTKEVMTAAVQANPITNLTLTELESTNYSTDVQADYTINGRTQTEKFYVSSRDGRWYLTKIAARVSVRSLSPADTGLTVNGVPVGDVEAIEVFPGGYTLGSTSDTFTFSKTKLVVESLSSSSSVYDIKVQLSDSALKSFRAATRSLVNSCKKPGSLKNARCSINFREPTGTKARPSTIACTPSGMNSIDRMKPTLDSTDMTVRGSLSVSFTCTMKGTNGRSYRGYESLVAVYGQKSGSDWKVSGERP
ncbi:MAG: hypothetical protein QM695_14275 [Micropruina sp.]